LLRKKSRGRPFGAGFFVFEDKASLAILPKNNFCMNIAFFVLGFAQFSIPKIT